MELKMARKGYHLLLFADYVIGAVFAFVVFAVSATAFAVTGNALQSRETQAIGNIYAGFLLRIEDGARALRADYCERGNVKSGTSCGDPDLLLGGPPGATLN
jgi:hypothetical protein